MTTILFSECQDKFILDQNIIKMNRYIDIGYKGGTINILVIVRNPIVRNLLQYIARRKNDNIFKRNFKLNKYRVVCENFVKNHDYKAVETGVRVDLIRLTKIDIYGSPFDKNKGYKFYENGKFKMLIVRYDDILACKDIIRNFLKQPIRFKMSRSMDEIVASKVLPSIPTSYKQQVSMLKYSQHFFDRNTLFECCIDVKKIIKPQPIEIEIRIEKDTNSLSKIGKMNKTYNFKNKNIILTISNNKYYECVLALIYSLKRKDSVDIVVFYFDMDKDKINILNNLHINLINIQDYVQIPPQLTHPHIKAYYLKTCLLIYAYNFFKDSNILYCDASTYFNRPIGDIFNIVDRENFFTVDHSDRNNNHYNLNYFDKYIVDKYSIDSSILFKKSVRSSLFGFKNHPSNTKLSVFFDDLLKMSRDLDIYCLEKFPKKRIRALEPHVFNNLVKKFKIANCVNIFFGSRQDQNILSYLVSKHGLPISQSIIYQFSIDGMASENNFNSDFLKATLNGDIMAKNPDVYTYLTRGAYCEFDMLSLKDGSTVNRGFCTNPEPILTVVTTTYNRAGFIKTLLQTLNTLNNKNFVEHIIVDNFSTDGTYDAILSYLCKTDISVRYVKKHCGIVDGINTGLKLARGMFITWLNDDDLYTNRDIVEVLRDKSMEEVYFGRGVYVDINGKTLKDQYINKNLSNNIYEFRNKVGVCQPATFIGRGIFVKIGYLSGDFPHSFDYEFWVRIIKSGIRFVYLDIYISKTVYHDDAISCKNRLYQLFESLLIVYHHIGVINSSWLDRLAKNILSEKANGLFNDTMEGLEKSKIQKIKNIVSGWINTNLNTKMDDLNTKMDDVDTPRLNLIKECIRKHPILKKI